MASQVTGQHDRRNTCETEPFILQFQERVETATPAGESTAIQAGTRTVTEVSSEASDADPTVRTHFAIKRRG